ncbi:MAG: trigger factor [Lachnospiraceae bacterium]
MKKKVVALFLATCMAVTAMAGCGSKKTEDKKETTSAQTEASDSKEASDEIEYNAADYVELGKYKGLEVTVEGNYKVTEEQVKSQINQACASYPEYEKTDKTKVENGDIVDIDYTGKKDGEEFDGGSATGYKLEIGSGTFIDGFETGLIGAEVGKEVSLNLTFPKDYQSEELAGQPVVFEVKVNGIVTKKDMDYDNLTDEYVTQNFSKNTVKEYVDEVNSNLQSQADSQKTTDTKSAVVDAVMKNCKVKSLPDGLLEQRVKEYKEQFEEQCKSYNMSVEDYLQQYYQMTEDDFDKSVNEYMTENINTELVFQAIADAEGLKADEKGFDEYLNNCMQQYGFQSEEDMFKTYSKDYMKQVYLYEKALNQIIEESKITYKEKEEESTSDTSESTNEAETTTK